MAPQIDRFTRKAGRGHPCPLGLRPQLKVGPFRQGQVEVLHVLALLLVQRPFGMVRIRRPVGAWRARQWLPPSPASAGGGGGAGHARPARPLGKSTRSRRQWAWLRRQMRKARHDAIAAYAAEMAGTNLDLDPELEPAGVEHLLNSGRQPG